jgi:hypothetical protein
MDTFCNGITLFIKLFHDEVLSYEGLDEDIADSIAALKADQFCLCLREWCRCVNESGMSANNLLIADDPCSKKF